MDNTNNTNSIGIDIGMSHYLELTKEFITNYKVHIIVLLLICSVFTVIYISNHKNRKSKNKPNIFKKSITNTNQNTSKIQLQLQSQIQSDDLCGLTDCIVNDKTTLTASDDDTTINNNINTNLNKKIIASKDLSRSRQGQPLTEIIIDL